MTFDADLVRMVELEVPAAKNGRVREDAYFCEMEGKTRCVPIVRIEGFGVEWTAVFVVSQLTR